MAPSGPYVPGAAATGSPGKPRIAQEMTLCYRFAVVFPRANAIDLSGAKRRDAGPHRVDQLSR